MGHSLGPLYQKVGNTWTLNHPKGAVQILSVGNSPFSWDISFQDPAGQRNWRGKNSRRASVPTWASRLWDHSWQAGLGGGRKPYRCSHASLLPALPHAGSLPNPFSHAHTHLTTLVLTFNAPLRAPFCQNAFPHRGPCLPAHSPRTCLPQKWAHSILNSWSCLPSVSSGGPRGLLTEENRIWKHRNGSLVPVPPIAPGPQDNRGILSRANRENSALG